VLGALGKLAEGGEGGVTRGIAGGGGGATAGGGDGGGDGGGGLTRGVLTVAVGTDGVWIVVAGTAGTEGVATVVDGSAGVVTVVVGSCPNAAPAHVSADAKPAAISPTPPTNPACRRPPAHTDRTTCLYPACGCS
jgi:hypothetical protein